MQRKGLESLDEVYDVRALRIIVNSKEDCYAALRQVEQLWQPIEGRHKVREQAPYQLLLCRHMVGCRKTLSVLCLASQPDVDPC